MKEPLLFLACHPYGIPLSCKYFLVYDINCLLFFKQKTTTYYNKKKSTCLVKEPHY